MSVKQATMAGISLKLPQNSRVRWMRDVNYAYAGDSAILEAADYAKLLCPPRLSLSSPYKIEY